MEQIQPFHLVSKFLKNIPQGLVLDIGAGMGRNSFFLAQNGFTVEAIDINENNINNIKKISEENNWRIQAFSQNLKNFDFINSKYSLILAIQCFNFIKKSEFDNVIEKIKNSLKQNSLMIISAFTTEDPSYKKLKEKHKPVEENTFYSANQPNWWHFFNKNELKQYFNSDFEILHFKEKIVEDQKPQPHFHGICEMVIKKISE